MVNPGAAIPYVVIGVGALLGLHYGLVRIGLGIAALVLGPALAGIVGLALGPAILQWATRLRIPVPAGLGLPILTAVLTVVLVGVAIQLASRVVDILPIVGGLNRLGGLVVGALGSAYAVSLIMALPVMNSPAFVAISHRLPSILAPMAGR